MIFSSTIAGVDQSMRRSTRKPRLNQDENRCTKSWSTGDRSSRCTSASIRSSRIETSAAVPPGARLSRRKSSWRRGSAARCSSAAASSEPSRDQASTAASIRSRSTPKRVAERLEERDAGAGGQFVVAREDLARERDTGSLAPTGQQFLAQLDQTVRTCRSVTAPVARAVDQRAPALRDRLQQFAEKRGVHLTVLKECGAFPGIAWSISLWSN